MLRYSVKLYMLYPRRMSIYICMPIRYDDYRDTTIVIAMSLCDNNNEVCRVARIIYERAYLWTAFDVLLSLRKKERIADNDANYPVGTPVSPEESRSTLARQPVRDIQPSTFYDASPGHVPRPSPSSFRSEASNDAFGFIHVFITRERSCVR